MELFQPCPKKNAIDSNSNPSGNDRTIWLTDLAVHCLDIDRIFTRLLGMCSASLASLTRETGPKVVKGDPARTAESPRVTHVGHHSYAPSFGISDSALKFTHVLYNLSPAGN